MNPAAFRLMPQREFPVEDPPDKPHEIVPPTDIPDRKPERPLEFPPRPPKAPVKEPGEPVPTKDPNR